MSETKIYDLLIIGAGPAGLTAAIYATRAMLSVAMIEKNYIGGKLTKTLSIENYPGFLENSGPKLSEIMAQQTVDNGVEHFDGDVVDLIKKGNLWETVTKKGSYFSKTVLVATGTKERVLGIPNEVDFYGNGVSYCAICEGNLYRGKDVVVVGGGNSATEESIYLSKIVNKVQLVHRRNEFRADPILVDHVKKIENITINTPFVPVSIEVEYPENSTDKTLAKVVGIKIKNVETQEESIIPCSCVFFYIGLLPEIYFLNNLELKKDDNGFICVDENMNTNNKGLFAAGDIISKNLRQVVTALNDGAIAAISAKNYINEHFPS